jgi:hypothetical protein
MPLVVVLEALPTELVHINGSGVAVVNLYFFVGLLIHGVSPFGV